MNTIFKTVDDVLNEPQFGVFIKDHINRIESNRANMLHEASKTKIDARIRRAPYDILKDAGKLHPNDFSEEFRLILSKKSKQPSAIRSFIYNLVTVEMRRTIEHFKPVEVDQEKKTKRSKSKKQPV